MWTFQTPQPLVTAAALKVTGMQLSPGNENATVEWVAVDGNGNPIPNSGGSFTITSPADLATLWAAGPGNTAALYSYLAAKLGWAVGTASAG